MDGSTALVLALAAVALWGMTRRSHRAHGHGDRAALALHEAGHAAAARHLGGRVHSITIDGGHGYTDATLPTDNPGAAIAFWYAGQLASPTVRHTEDDQLIRRELRKVPRADRDRVRRDAHATARRIVASRSGEIRRTAAKLDQNGRL